jgi:hypothetical protein
MDRTTLKRAQDHSMRKKEKTMTRLFLHRGGEHGHDVRDWLHAERELRQARD